jgi:hypothetical protein
MLTTRIEFWVFIEVNAPPLVEEIAQHHAQIEWVGQSPISA